MPRDVDEREVEVAQPRVREAEIDGDSARLLFFQTVGVRARERVDQRALAMVDVAGGPDDDGADHVIDCRRRGAGVSTGVSDER